MCVPSTNKRVLSGQCKCVHVSGKHGGQDRLYAQRQYMRVVEKGGDNNAQITLGPCWLVSSQWQYKTVSKSSF